MLINGLTLAVLTTTGFVIVYKKLPRKIRKLIEKHSLITDAVALLLTYILFGGTLTALVAAAMVGVFVSILLHIANNPDNFMYLYDACELMKVKLNDVKNALNRVGAAYRDSKGVNVEFTEEPSTS